MGGILYLIPTTLGSAEPGLNDPLSSVIPLEVLEITSRINYFIAENAKTTRAFLKQVGARHPLAAPLQEIKIAELNVNTEVAQLPALLEPLLAGQDAGLIS